MKLSCADGSTLSGAQLRNQLTIPAGESADAVGRYNSFGRGLPVSSAMYRMNAVLNPPPAMRILRVAGCAVPPVPAPARRAPARIPAAPTALDVRKSLRFISLRSKFETAKTSSSKPGVHTPGAQQLAARPWF